MKQGYDAVFIVDICFFPYEGVLHLVEGFLEILLILSRQEFSDMLQLAFTIRDRVDLDALYKDLNYWCRLRKFCPGKRKTVKRYGKVLLGCTANHQLENANAQ